MKVLPPDRCFGQIPLPWSGYEAARLVVLPLPFEATTTYMTGTALGPAAILEASSQVELYDEELHCEPFRAGMATLEAPDLPQDPAAALEAVSTLVGKVLDDKRIPLLLGGEHTITIGGVTACLDRRPKLGVVHLDAHADLRDSYEDRHISHATVLRRVTERCPTLGLGIRSLSAEEAEYAATSDLALLTASELRNGANWRRLLERLPDEIYLSIDLDVLDPSEMPSVGTPEPGGLRWPELTEMLGCIVQYKKVVAADIVELCPPAGLPFAAFTAARLAYRLAGLLLEARA